MSHRDDRKSTWRWILQNAGVFCLFGAGSVGADVIRVPQDYPTFRAGLAATAPGETLLVGSGFYSEPGGPAFVNPGVTVIGSGPGFSGTSLSSIELFFVAGSDSAIVQNLSTHKRVSSDNSLGVMRRCAFSLQGPLQDGYVAFVRGGLIIEECFIRCQPMQEPFKHFNVQGGSFIMRNCVVAVPWTFYLFDIMDIGPYPLELVEIRDNTFFSESEMGIIIDATFPIPGPIVFVNNIFQASAGMLGFSCVGNAVIQREFNVFSSTPHGNCGGLSGTNLIVDPMICDPHYLGSDLKDFEIHYDSPCVGAGIGGTTIGALEIGCGVPAGVADDGAPRALDFQIDVRPNPFASGGTLLIASRYQGPAVVRLFDSNGRLVIHRLLDLAREESVLNLEDVLGRSMNYGVHYLEVSQGNRKSVCKIVVAP